MTEKTLYQDGIEVQDSDLNNTEEYIINDIKRKQKEFAQYGVATGLRVTGSGGGSVTISAGVGYNINAERIYLSVDETVPCPAGGYYFICLIYTEVEENSKPHESTGDAYFTRIRETYTITVLSESAYNALSQTNKDNILVVAIVNGSVIQQASLTDDVITSTELLINGMDLLRFGTDTQEGKAEFNYEWSDASRVGYLWYKAPNDTSFGNVLSIPSDGDYDIYSNNGNLLRVRAKIGLIPRENLSDVYTDVSYFYEDGMTGSGRDGFHRVILGSSLPQEKNAHGIATENIDGEAIDIRIHRKRMHSNCVKGRANALLPQISGSRIKVAYLHTNDSYFIQGREYTSITGSNYITITGSGGSKYVAIDEAGRLVQSTDTFDDDYLPICKVDVSGGNLSNLIDMRDMESHGDVNFQEDSVVNEKFFRDDRKFRLSGAPVPFPKTVITQRNLWDEGDNTLINALVRGEDSNADVLHEHGQPDWTDKWYLKTLLGKGIRPNPPSPIPEPDPAYDGSDWRGLSPEESNQYKSASSVIGSVLGAIEVIVPSPATYVAPAQDAIEENLSCTARVGEDLSTLQETIDYLASLMRNLRNRYFPDGQEVMHTSGRMLNLTFIPLPNNNISAKDDDGNVLDGKWKDGEEVTQEESTWIVSPTFLWGIGGIHIPWCYVCSTFGLGTGGDQDPKGGWKWGDWCNWFDILINGNFLYGRWVVAFFAQSAGDIVTMLSQILVSHINYSIVASHQIRLDNNWYHDVPENVRGGEASPKKFDKYNAVDGVSFNGDPRDLGMAGKEEWGGETYPIPPDDTKEVGDKWIKNWEDEQYKTYNEEDKPKGWRGAWKDEYGDDQYSSQQYDKPASWPPEFLEDGSPNPDYKPWPPDATIRPGKDDPRWGKDGYGPPPQDAGGDDEAEGGGGKVGP